MSELRPLGDTAAVAAAAVGPATLPATTATQPLSTEESVTENSHQTNVAASVAQDQPAPAAALDPSSTQKDTIEPVEKKEESSSVTKSIMEGTLGYKAPGLVKGLRFSKKYFWFGDEAIPTKSLHSYLRGEKPDVAHHNAAWSSQTGRGLLYFSKQIEHKSTPGGIINLAEASDLIKEGGLEFHFKLHGQKHSFQAASMSERDAWVAGMERAAAEAKATSSAIMAGSGYKEHMEKLGKPAAVVIPSTAAKTESTTPKKSVEELKRGNTSASTSSSETGTQRGRTQKSRSVSRKRASLFGAFLGKKEEHDEKKVEKKEEKVDDKIIPPAESEVKKEETSLEKIEHPIKASEPVEASLDANAIAARVMAEPVVSGEEIKPAPIAKDDEVMPVDKPVVPEAATTEQSTSAPPKEIIRPNKRNSFFGSFFQRKDVASPVEEKTEKEVVPPVPAKDIDAPAVAPVVLSPAPVAESVAPVPPKDATTTTSTAPAMTEPVLTPKVEKSASLPKEGFFGKLMKQEKVKHQEKKEEKTEAGVAVASEQVVATPTANEVSTTAPTTTENIEAAATENRTATLSNHPPALKDKKRSSFFNTLGGRREKRAEVPSDAEHTDGEAKPKIANASPLPKLSGLFRMPSRAAKTHLESAKKPASQTAEQTGMEQGVAHGQETSAVAAGEAVPSTATERVLPEPRTTSVVNGAIGDVPPTTTQMTPEVQATA